MTKKETMKELRRYYHIARKTKAKSGYSDGIYCEGMMAAYYNAMELLSTRDERKNLYKFIWADTSTEY